jgi:hypothetical protein
MKTVAWLAGIFVLAIGQATGVQVPASPPPESATIFVSVNSTSDREPSRMSPPPSPGRGGGGGRGGIVIGGGATPQIPRDAPPPLSRWDFEVRMDGDVCEVIEAVTGLPLSAVLLFDVSGSVSYVNQRDLERVGVEPIEKLGPEDRLSLSYFGKEVVVGPLTRNPAELEQRGQDLRRAIQQVDGPSPLWDAMTAALTTLNPIPPGLGRRAIVLVTDGRTTGNLTRFEFVQSRVTAMGVTVSTILQGSPVSIMSARPDAIFWPTERPRWLAVGSGGLAIPDRGTSGSLKSDVIGLLTDLRLGYRLTFKPVARDGRRHDLAVRMRRAGVAVRGPTSFVSK